MLKLDSANEALGAGAGRPAVPPWFQSAAGSRAPAPGIVRSVEPLLDERELHLVVQLAREEI
jgi:hypothetical protein